MCTAWRNVFQKLYFHAFVKFFAPWCGHCKALHPHFEKMCQDLSDEDDFIAAVVDATEEEAFAKRHGVTGFPTINWYPKREFSVGQPESFEGSRSQAALLDFVNKKTGWGVAPGGGLSSKAGRVKKMDQFVKEWVAHGRLPENLIDEAREAVSIRAHAAVEANWVEGERNDGKTYVTIFEKLKKNPDYLIVRAPAHTTAAPLSLTAAVLTRRWSHRAAPQEERARLRRLLYEGSENKMSKSKARVLGRRLNVLRVFEYYEEKLPGKPKASQETHTIYTAEQLQRFPRDELIEIVLEMQEKGCDTFGRRHPEQRS